jgi:hypothetical protein
MFSEFHTARKAHIMAADYRVLTQRPTTELTADGRFIDTVEISFETLPNQTPGTLTVPRSQYNADNVQRLIEEQVATIKAIENL